MMLRGEELFWWLADSLASQMERPPFPPCPSAIPLFRSPRPLPSALSGTSMFPVFAPPAHMGANQGSDGGCYQEAHSYLETPGIYIRLSHPGLSFLCPAPSMKSESLCPRGWGLWKPRLGDELPHLEIFCAWGLGCMFTFGGLHGYSLLAVCRRGRMRGSHSQRRATRPASCSMLP